MGAEVGTARELEEDESTYAQWCGGRPKYPTAATGLNVWSWNYRYACAADFEGMIIWSGRPQLGPIAPPGEYTVTMTVDGQTQSKTVQLKSDPRFDIPDAQIQAQFAFAMEIRDALDAANKGVIRIRHLKSQLVEQLGDEPAKRLARASNDFVAKLSAVEGELYQVKNVSPQDPLNFPIKLNNRLAYLQKSTESGDGLPTQGQRDVFALLQGELDELLTSLDDTIAADLPKVNALLMENDLQAVSDGDTTSD